MSVNIHLFLTSLIMAVATLFPAFRAEAQNKYEDSYNYQRNMKALVFVIPNNMDQFFLTDYLESVR